MKEIFNKTTNSIIVSSILALIVGLIMIIFAKFKCPKSKKVNTLMIVYIVIGIIIVGGTILFLSALNSCITECEGIAKTG